MRLRLLLNLAKDKFRLWVPKKAWYRLAKLKRKIYRKNFSEEFKTYPKKEPPLYFVIRREPPGAGLFSNLNHILQGLLVAEKRKLIPVIDMQNYWTSYSISSAVNGSRNAWEYFFDQPTNYSLNDAYNSNRYVLSKGNRIAENHWLTQKSLEYALESEKILEVNRLLTQYIKFNSFTTSTLEYVKTEIDWNPQGNLGVSLRGTDYLKIRPHGHPKQPSIQAVLKEIDEVLIRKPDLNIFLACEDLEIRNTIERQFPGSVLKNFRDTDFFKEFVSRELKTSKRNSEVMTNALGYLIEIILFSECNSCVTTLANGSVIGLGLNGGRFFENRIMTLGVY